MAVELSEPILTDQSSFFSLNEQFEDVDDQIEVQQFLKACDGIVRFVRLLGSLFSPVARDIQNNITKISAFVDSNKAPFLHDIVDIEARTLKPSSSSSSPSSSLLLPRSYLALLSSTALSQTNFTKEPTLFCG
jgi:hypothetical protein